MISTHYMREIQKDNERNIERANEFKSYDAHEGTVKRRKLGIIPWLLNTAGSGLVKIGTRLQGFSFQG